MNIRLIVDLLRFMVPAPMKASFYEKADEAKQAKLTLCYEAVGL